jgi:hypothetical protein
MTGPRPAMFRFSLDQVDIERAGVQLCDSEIADALRSLSDARKRSRPACRLGFHLAVGNSRPFWDFGNSGCLSQTFLRVSSALGNLGRFLLAVLFQTFCVSTAAENCLVRHRRFTAAQRFSDSRRLFGICLLARRRLVAAALALAVAFTRCRVFRGSVSHFISFLADLCCVTTARILRAVLLREAVQKRLTIADACV